MPKLLPVLVLFGFFFVYACQNGDKEEMEESISSSTFVGSNTCQSCHQEQFSSWEGSHHEQAMKVADEKSILGNFENTTFLFKGIKSTFFKKESEFYVNTEGPDGTNADYKIAYTFGVTPLQQYLIEFPNGAFQCLSTAWDSEANKWFHLQPDIDIKHDEWLHWTGGAMNWNTMCADCHSTNVQKNYDPLTEAYQTTFSEINVSCESCHGPSSEHVNYYDKPASNALPPKMYMEKAISSKTLVQKCARCHSRRSQITEAFDYEGDFLDHYSPSLLVNGLYELDGQISDEVYVYGSFIQSKMYHNDVSCKDCHDVHSLELKAQGNLLCLNCHEPSYDSPAHNFHEANSEGAQCINCHMPGKIYMGNDFRRDHSFRVPRPDQTVTYQVPNACNTCHTDKSAQWASDVIVDKFGPERADHFSDHLLKGYFGDQVENGKLISNSGYPEIARATAVNQYASQPLSAQDIEALVLYLKDPSPLVRNEVISSLERINNTSISKNIEPLLKDSLRMVRISAARYFNMTEQDVSTIAGFKEANDEFLEAMNMTSDFASGQHQIALYHQSKGNSVEATKAYEKAIAIDNYFNRSRMNLALLYYQAGKIPESEELYLKVIEQEPDFSYPYYMLGLLYNESGDNQKALDYLGQATLREPANQNAFYNFALKLQEAQEIEKSIEVLSKALLLFPNDERILYAKFIGEVNSNLISDARETCMTLIRIAPNNQQYQQMLQRLNQTIPQ